MVFSIMDKQFKGGDLQTPAFNELAAGLYAGCPQLTFYLAPGVPPPERRPAGLPRGCVAPARTASCPSCHGRGVEGLKIIPRGWRAARRLALLSLKLLWDF